MILYCLDTPLNARLFFFFFFCCGVVSCVLCVRCRLTEVIRILRKRLGSPNLRTLNASLTLAETLVKNCGAPVHREVGSERFMAAVAKIARVSLSSSNNNNSNSWRGGLESLTFWSCDYNFYSAVQ